MASEPYERPQLPSYSRALNDRQRLLGQPSEVGQGGHLTITEDGAVRYGVHHPQAGRSAYLPIELDYDRPDVMLNSVDGWAAGLTEDQVRAVMAIGGTYQQRVFLADGYREMNTTPSEPNGTVRRPRYVNPSDAANTDAAGVPVETLREREVTPEQRQKRSRIPVPPDAVNDQMPTTPVTFTEVDALSLRTIPSAVRKRVRGPRGSRGEVKDFRGRPLDR